MLSQPFDGVFKSATFSIVFRMVFECTSARMAGVAIARCGLCSTGINQTIIPFESDKVFCVYSVVPYRQTTRRRQPSRYG